MFGAFRLLLAMVVAAFHSGFTPGGYWIGISAVVGFYILSGYAITGLLLSRFNRPNSYLVFYWERFIRLAPQYYFWIAVAALLVGLAHISMSSAEWRPLEGLSVLLYVLLIPLAFQPYLPPIEITHLITHSTSLAIEVTFYVLAPWIFTRRIPGYIAAFFSLGIFAATAFGWLTPFVFTYASTPGPLIFAMLGSFIYRQDWRALSVCTICLTLCLLPMHKFDAEILIGLIFCIPIILALREYRSGRWDQALGDASYGCFLCHKCFLFVILEFFPLYRDGWVIYASVAFLGAIVGYFSFIFIERPTIGYRRRLRS